MRLRVLMVMTAALLAVPAVAHAAAKIDYAQPGSAFQILAPGEWGGVPLNDHSTDQLKLYDALTPLRGNVTQAATLAKRNRTEFYKLLQRHHLEPAMFKGGKL